MIGGVGGDSGESERRRTEEKGFKKLTDFPIVFSHHPSFFISSLRQSETFEAGRRFEKHHEEGTPFSLHHRFILFLNYSSCQKDDILNLR